MNDNLMIILSVSSLVVALGAIGVCLGVVRRVGRVNRRIMSALAVAESDLRITGLNLQDTSGRMRRLERSSVTLKAAQNHLESRATASVNYGQAINLVQRGWRQEDLISTCGLTRGEAELVYMLHGPGGGLKGKSAYENQ